ncbi:hypothetical protein HF521_021291 [Silurus meridionalis]|uniref:Uncharacterized protein n=1 Tax=Silurus meridionalis TaxID=175797 RepID=A0A8T0BBF1_SILME|nr:hypothetical protein HF521_021291 [Silurus meridionalis]
MGAQDDVEAFLELFGGGGHGEWTEWRALRLLPLLSGEAQLAAQQLLADRMLEYGILLCEDCLLSPGQDTS